MGKSTIMAIKPRKSVGRLRKREEFGAPTAERLIQAGRDGFAVGDDGQGRRKVTILSPLARLYARDGIDAAAYHALQKFRVHWHNAGLEPSVGSIDLNRIFAGGESSAGMPTTERQAFHRQQYRNAVMALGMIGAKLVEAVVCAEHTLEDAGGALGYASSFRAREGAASRLRECGAVLARLWGM